MSWPGSPRTRMRPIGPASPMRGRAAAAYFLGRRQIGQIGPMALARVHRRQAGGAPCRQQAPVGLDRAAQLRDVVAEHFAEAARLEKIPLHVDDQQRAMLGLEREGIGFSRDVYCLAHCAPVARRPVTTPDARNMPVASTRTIVVAGRMVRRDQAELQHAELQRRCRLKQPRGPEIGRRRQRRRLGEWMR